MSARRVRLSDLAHVVRSPASRPDEPDSAALRTSAGDVILETSPAGRVARVASEEEELRGRQTIVLRLHNDSDVLPGWLQLWLESDEFAALADQHSTGSTLRALSVKDLGAFEVPVPPVAAQQNALEALEPISQALAAERELVGVLESLQQVESRRAYLRSCDPRFEDHASGGDSIHSAAAARNQKGVSG